MKGNERRKHQWKKKSILLSFSGSSLSIPDSKHGAEWVVHRTESGLSILVKCQQSTIRGVLVNLQCLFYMSIGFIGCSVKFLSFLENVSVEYSPTGREK